MNNRYEKVFTGYNFSPVIRHEGSWHLFDFTKGYKPDLIKRKKWGIGRYNEKRSGMYEAPHYENKRNIHIGIDFWTPAGEPVYVFYEGEIAYLDNNNRKGDYGPTIVTKHSIGDTTLFALYGHLNKKSLGQYQPGDKVEKGRQLAQVGDSDENGNWEPHLHFQLSLNDPGEADMPGVVSEENLKTALVTFPDPRLVLGNIY